MPENQLTLTNAALSEAGGKTTIASVDEKSPEARKAAQLFSRTVRSVLALIPWDFATTRSWLETIAATQPLEPPYTTAFRRPDDALVIQAVYSRAGGSVTAQVPIFPGAYGQQNVGGARVAFGLGMVGSTRAVLTTVPAASARYTRWETTFDLWSPMAIELLIMTLASKLSFQIAGDKTLRDRLKNDVIALESRARTMAANESTDIVDIPADWILAREADEFLFVGGTPGSGTGNDGGGSGGGGGGGGSGITINVIDNGGIFSIVDPLDLPTTPPGSSGQLWNDGGILAVTP